MKSMLLMRKTSYRILHTGGTMPPGSIRTWGGKEYVKVAPGDWRPLVAGKEKMKESVEKWYSHQLTLDELK
jgi:hypothetical protein